MKRRKDDIWFGAVAVLAGVVALGGVTGGLIGQLEPIVSPSPSLEEQYGGYGWFGGLVDAIQNFLSEEQSPVPSPTPDGLLPQSLPILTLPPEIQPKPQALVCDSDVQNAVETIDRATAAYDLLTSKGLMLDTARVACAVGVQGGGTTDSAVVCCGIRYGPEDPNDPWGDYDLNVQPSIVPSNWDAPTQSNVSWGEQQVFDPSRCPCDGNPMPPVAEPNESTDPFLLPAGPAPGNYGEGRANYMAVYRMDFRNDGGDPPAPSCADNLPALRRTLLA